MESPITFKRRRLNESRNILSKPFVSPLKTPKPDRTPLQQNNNAANLLYQPSVLAHTINPTFPSATTATRTSQPRNFNPAKTTAIHKQSIVATPSKHISGGELAVQKALMSLETQIRQLRGEICHLTQAFQLLSSTSNADLEALGQKWKVASQAAADELFESAKERVDRMGGVAAWRESEKTKHDWDDGLGRFEEADRRADADCEFDSEGEELPEKEQEWRKSEKRRLKREIEGMKSSVEDVEADGQESEQDRLEQDEVDENETFTMDMMLRSLSIDLNIIGYDKVAQNWVT